MKSVIFVSTLVGSVAVVAQGVGDLPPCGQVCVGNMVGLAEQLGCPPVNGKPDTACLCSKPDFGYGIRDCASEACQQKDVAPVINYGLSYCANAVAISASGAETLTAVATPAAASAMIIPGVISPPAGYPTNGPSTVPVSGATVPVLKTGIVSTFTSGNSTITSTISGLETLVPTGSDGSLVTAAPGTNVAASSNATVSSDGASATATSESSSSSDDGFYNAAASRTTTTTSKSTSASVGGAAGAYVTMPVANMLGPAAIAALAFVVV
ncbi:CFEM domain-containing protein [Cercophora scortea]|uniref:CFEM domain-containing protein n=1 Tax=Cercophora scortea TaxID=314031 RepID=A0AAE0ML89_9PEZI|nr:CFEM domain-containing protein [Cercophora scortea]